MRPSVLLIAILSLISATSVNAQTDADWQQSVAYEMDIHLLADRHQMQGSQRLTYYNNSPDTLYRVYYHLYFNAFNPNSQMAERNRHLPDPDSRVVPRIFNLEPEEVGYHRIETLTYDGRPVPFDIFDTVMEVRLDQPILPHSEAVFEMQFASQVPLQTRRSGRDNAEGIDYSMSQWYPKLAAYDERGWHTDPYIGREFFAPFGTFDVRITLPAEYVIGATGVLQNPNEIGHGYQTSGGPVHTNGDSLTWHFAAENVHDFAWAADPDYIHEMFTGEMGVTYHLLYQPDVAALWQPLREWAPGIIQFMSEHYGRYPWPQFSVIQGGDGGMEYPMLTLISGRRSSVLGVTAHEAAHMWYYGVLASDETDHAWMDEGFANYTSTETVAHINGQQQGNHTRAQFGIVSAKHYGYYEPLDTPSDWFETNAAYGIAAYSGGQTLVDMLGYVISPPLRDAWLREYFERFKFRHPYPEDAEKVAEDVSGLHLDWYFDEFLDRDEQLDYAVADLDVQPSGSGTWRTTIRLERETAFWSPVDLVLRLEDGTYQWVNVPLSLMRGHKPVPPGWIVAEPWAWADPDYTFTLDLPSRPVEIILDPFLQTPDANRLNNEARLPVDAEFLQPSTPAWTSYSVGYRPLAQFAQDFGFGAGVQARGEYIFNQHELKAMLKLWPQVIASGGDAPSIPARSSWFDGVDYELSFSQTVPGFGPFVRGTLSFQKHLGILENTLAVQAQLGRYPLFTDVARTFTAGLQHQYRPSGRDFNVVGLAFERAHILSAFAEFEISNGPDLFRIGLEAGSALDRWTRFEPGDPLPTNPHPTAGRLVIDATKTADLGSLLGRASLRLGIGTRSLALQKRFRLGQATVEDAWRNDAFRTISAALEGPRREVFAAFADAGPVSANLVYPSTRMLAGTLALGTGPIIRAGVFQPLRAEVFSGAGLAWDGGLDLTRDFLADAGFGLSYEVPALGGLSRWIAQSDVLSTLRLRAKFPFWVNEPRLIGEQEQFAFRMLLGIEVAR